MRYRLVIFDFDGTLADSFPWFVAVLNDVADRFRFRRVGEDQVDALRRSTHAESLAAHGPAELFHSLDEIAARLLSSR